MYTHLASPTAWFLWSLGCGRNTYILCSPLTTLAPIYTYLPNCMLYKHNQLLTSPTAWFLWSLGCGRNTYILRSPLTAPARISLDNIFLAVFTSALSCINIMNTTQQFSQQNCPWWFYTTLYDWILKHSDLLGVYDVKFWFKKNQNLPCNSYHEISVNTCLYLDYMAYYIINQPQKESPHDLMACQNSTLRQ